MIQRCHCPTNKDYKRYGGRGIRVCSRWRKSFINFYNDMGEKPGRHYSVGRKDNDGDYCPENCHWELPIQQANNTRRTRKYKFGGFDMTVRELTKFSTVPYTTLRSRLNLGWEVEEALYSFVLYKWEKPQW
jgi:hypothetical protein